MGDEPREYVLRDRATLAHVRDLQETFPIATHHRNALRVLGSDFSYASRNTDGTWTALIKFSPGLEGLFGLTREVLAVYSSHPDLQPRMYHALPRYRQGLARDRTAEDHLYFISSPDVTAVRKLDNWSPTGPYVAVALPRVRDEPRRSAEEIRNALLDRLAKRNLYDETLPVTGRDFFGRRQLLQQLSEEIRLGNVCGIYGLRKTGKTSLLKELQTRYLEGENAKRRIFVLRDLETLPSDPSRIARDFTEDLRSALLPEFRVRGVRTHELHLLASDASVGEFRRALRPCLDDAQEQNISLVLALDEVESLLGDSETLDRGSRDAVPEILGMLRSLVQETSQFNVLLSGITSAVTERGVLYKRENPLFSWAKSIYVPPMTKAEIDSLTIDVGARMAISWEQEAIDDLYSQSGGHVFLHRTLATEVIRLLPTDLSRRLVNIADIHMAIPSWGEQIVDRLREMWGSASRHYPTECDLLAAVAIDPDDTSSLTEVFPDETRKLAALDLVRVAGDTITIAPLTQQLIRFGII